MSQNNSSILYVGLDVAKLSLQLHVADSSHSLANDRQGHARLLKLLRAQPNAHIVCEATGGYEQPIVRALQAADIPVSIIEAGRVRYFARAQGQRAKTDLIDAAVLSSYGAIFKPSATPGVSPQQQRLADLCQRRRQLIHTRTAEHNRAEHYTDPLCMRQARQLQKTLEKQIDQCDQAITTLIAEDAGLARKARRLEAIAGVGPVVAATVLAEMPELGKLNPQTAAALAGVAPYNHDSGGQKGLRHVKGGRRSVRCALYMATLSAVRHDPILKEFYLRLRASGKKPLVAMTACMRKLIVLMNRLLKNENFQLAN
jgi:transposase